MAALAAFSGSATFTAGDAGTRSFTVTLPTVGDQTIRATDSSVPFACQATVSVVGRSFFAVTFASPDVWAASAALVLTATAGCVGGVTPAACAIDSDCGPAAFCNATACYQGKRDCPVIQPTFSSINKSFFQVGCGVKQRNCHAFDSAVVQSGPAFTGDLYRTLVDAPAANRQGRVRDLVLVKPGDPEHSFLMIKLRLADSLNADYGGGQPASAPGSTCAANLSAIEQWIRKGAPND